MSDAPKLRRLVVFVVGLVVLGPVMVVGGAIAALAILGEWIGGGSGGLLDRAFGGPLASAGSPSRYALFMVGAVVAVGCFESLKWLWGRYRR